MTMITPSYLGETIEYSSLHACRSTLEDPTLSLSVFSPSARTMHVLVSDDAALLGTLDDTFDDGRVWLTVPSSSVGLGPIWLPDYLAHQLGNISHPELAALNSKRCDPSDLPPCNSEDSPALDVGSQAS